MSPWPALFTAVLNMSITASYVAVGVMIVRLLLKKAPKIFSYVLWIAVFFRLVCPFAFTSVFSFLRLINPSGMPDYVPRDLGLMQEPAVNFGIDSLTGAVNASLPPATPMASVNPLQIWLAALSSIWLAGILILLIYSIISYAKIKNRLKTATLVRDNIFETDQIGTAFLCGFINPRIYIPAGVNQADLSHILLHEQTHIRRRDYLIKPLAFLALILHWFNPLMWLSFALMSRDMEMSCDESVLRQLGGGGKSGYSSSLLSLSIKKDGFLAANPLAFGESHVKARIKNVLNYKKPTFWVILICALAVTAAVIGFTANPQAPPANHPDLNFGIIGGADGPTKIIITSDISQLVEENLAIIMSSPKESSNPQDYIDAHQREFENILKFGGEDALSYMLAQFKNGNADGLRGHLMMRLCKSLLGVRNNVTDNSLSPQAWFDALSVQPETRLPDFVYDGTNPIEKLVYQTEVVKNSAPARGFTIVAPKIFGSYEEGDWLKVFVTTYSATYRLYGSRLEEDSGGVVPAAITYKKDGAGNYVLSAYEPAKDGAYFAPSIRQFCTMPKSGREIPGLADKIFAHYGNYQDIISLQRANLIKHLRANNQNEVALYSPSGEILFLMSNPQFTPEIIKDEGRQQ